MADWESIGKVRAIKVGNDNYEMVDIFLKKIADKYFFAVGEDYELVDISYYQTDDVFYGRSVSWNVFIPKSIFMKLGIVSK